MDLPDWIDQPVRPAPFDEVHDAIGKLIVTTQAVEVWLQINAVDVTLRRERAKVRNQPASEHVERIRRQVHLVPEGDRAELLEVLDRTDELLKFRHAIVHGTHYPHRDGLRWQAQKRNRRPDPLSEFPHVSLVNFDVEYLVGAARAASSIGDYFFSKMNAWPGIQDPEDDL